MAEIKIEKKTPVWPWIIGALVVLVILALVLFSNDDDDYQNDTSAETIEELSNDSIVDDRYAYDANTDYTDSQQTWMTYQESIKDSTRIGSDSTYTNNALKNLASVVVLAAQQNDIAPSDATQELKEFSDYDYQTHNSTKMSENRAEENDFKSISNNISLVLESIQAKKYPELQNDVIELKHMVNNMPSTNIALENSKSAVKKFFDKANSIVNKFNS